MGLIYRISSFIALFILCSCFSGKHGDTDEQIPVKSLIEDLKVLRTTLQEAHPGLYWYTPKNQMDAYFDSLASSIKQSKTKLDFLKFLMPAIAKIHCAHTNIRFGEELSPEMRAKTKVFPLNVAVLNERVYIKQNNADTSQTGFEIKSINQVPIKDMIDRMTTVIPADGFNKSFKRHFLSTVGFQEAYALIYGEPDQFLVDVTDLNNKSVQLILSPNSANDFRYESPSGPSQIDLKFLYENKIAILSIKTFVFGRQYFNEQIAAAFEQIRQKKSVKLIIDMRNNGGGNNANVTELYSYLSEKPFYHLRKTEVTAKTLTYSKHITNYEDITNARSRPASDGTHQVDHQYPGRTLRQPAENSFKGELIVLANGGTNSAASEFVALVQGNRRGLVVGEETGGCYYGATGGRYLNLVLPNSQLAVTIPMVRIYNAVPEDYFKQPLGRGTLPNYEVVTSPQDLRSSKDRVLEFALALFE